MVEAGDGKTIKFIRDHVSYPYKDWCLIWPFATARGYGHFQYKAKRYYAHRFMCELVHGCAPSDIHEAAHACGDARCVNPHHLSWKTPSENQFDRWGHGTHVRSTYGNSGKITFEQASVIRSLEGTKTLRELADEYGVTEAAISSIWRGKSHSRPSKVNHWTPAEDDCLRDCVRRGLNFPAMSREIGRPVGAVMARAYRLGLKSGTPIDLKGAQDHG
jgi:hypothetical protein